MPPRSSRIGNHAPIASTGRRCAAWRVHLHSPTTTRPLQCCFDADIKLEWFPHKKQPPVLLPPLETLGQFPAHSTPGSRRHTPTTPRVLDYNQDCPKIPRPGGQTVRTRALSGFNQTLTWFYASETDKRIAIMDARRIIPVPAADGSDEVIVVEVMQQGSLPLDVRLVGCEGENPYVTTSKIG